MFCDIVEIYVKAGDGGNGRMSLLHEKFREYGGPDGGNGGDGGNIIFQVDPSWNTLYFYKTHRELKAENGEMGKASKQHGRGGDDLIVKVPIGTNVINSETGQILADLSDENQEVIIAKGGEGGFGNAHFTSSVRQKPMFAELGTKGQDVTLRLELKLIADVGLVGLPNIGKSTLLSVVSAAKPRIADYPFTTITPNLGVVEKYSNKGFVMADIPGLIEGASAGKGLGDEFLRHIERTRLIVHIIDAMSNDMENDFTLINKELSLYNKEMLKKPQILAISRADLLNKAEADNIYKKAQKMIAKNKKIIKFEKEPILFSAVTHQGLKELMYDIEIGLDQIPKKKKEDPIKIFTIADVRKDFFEVKKSKNKYIVTGEKIERFAQKTSFDNQQAVMRLYDIMKRSGIIKQVEKLGAGFGDKIVVSGQEFEYRG